MKYQRKREERRGMGKAKQRKGNHACRSAKSGKGNVKKKKETAKKDG